MLAGSPAGRKESSLTVLNFIVSLLIVASLLF